MRQKANESQNLTLRRVNDEDSEKNALDIPEILHIVLGYISKIQDLKKVRAVSKKWKDETFKKWRNSAVFLINKETRAVLVKAFDWRALAAGPKSQKKKLLAKNDPFLLREFPFKNYRFQTGIPRRIDLETDLILKEVIAPHADYLDLGCIFFTFPGFNHPSDDALECILRYNLKVTELAWAPLKKDGSDFCWSVFYSGGGQSRAEALNLRQLTLREPNEEDYMGGLVPLFKTYDFEDFRVHSNLEFAHWFTNRMPNLKALHEIKGAQAGIILFAMICAAENGQRILLEDITVLETDHPTLLAKLLSGYLIDVRPPLQILKVPVNWMYCTRVLKDFLNSTLQIVQDTLQTLELKVDCEGLLPKKRKKKIPQDEFYLNEYHFSNLTCFKVLLDYPNEFINGMLLSFDLNHLRKMPKLKEFFFGFKTPKVYHEPSMNLPSTRLFTFNNKVDILSDSQEFDFGPMLTDQVEGEGLIHLKSFHFHRNLTSSGLRLLSKWMKNLTTLETVFDEENFSAVGECWPRLRSLKLLQGSKVPKEKFNFSSSIDIADESDMFYLA